LPLESVCEFVTVVLPFGSVVVVCVVVFSLLSVPVTVVVWLPSAPFSTVTDAELPLPSVPLELWLVLPSGDVVAV
jgi:hypothetical protein